MYGMAAPALAEKINFTVEEAQKIINDFYDSFPSVRKWTDKTQSDAKANGYVVDLWGRRRRLPDIQLPKYSIKYKGSTDSFNPLLGSKGVITNVSSQLIDKYRKKLDSCKGKKDYEKVKKEAELENIEIFNNGAYISRAERQCVNARIQGGAASMSKIAMRKVFDNEELKRLGFHLLLQIHDELIGECPKENAEKCVEILTDIMKHSVEPLVEVPFKCDGFIVSRWYDDDFGDILREEYNGLIKSGKTEKEAEYIMAGKYTELSERQLYDYLHT